MTWQHMKTAWPKSTSNVHCKTHHNRNANQWHLEANTPASHSCTCRPIDFECTCTSLRNFSNNATLWRQYSTDLVWSWAICDAPSHRPSKLPPSQWTAPLRSQTCRDWDVLTNYGFSTQGEHSILTILVWGGFRCVILDLSTQNHAESHGNIRHI